MEDALYILLHKINNKIKDQINKLRRIKNTKTRYDLEILLRIRIDIAEELSKLIGLDIQIIITSMNYDMNLRDYPKLYFLRKSLNRNISKKNKIFFKYFFCHLKTKLVPEKTTLD